jgi:hypothetical protein
MGGEMLRLWRGRSHLKFGERGKEEKAESRKDEAEKHEHIVPYKDY